MGAACEFWHAHVPLVFAIVDPPDTPKIVIWAKPQVSIARKMNVSGLLTFPFVKYQIPETYSYETIGFHQSLNFPLRNSSIIVPIIHRDGKSYISKCCFRVNNLKVFEEINALA